MPTATGEQLEIRGLAAQGGAAAVARTRRAWRVFDGADGRGLVDGAFDLFETVLGTQRHLLDTVIARQRLHALQIIDAVRPQRDAAR